MIAPMNFANTKIRAESLPARYRATDRPIEKMTERAFFFPMRRLRGSICSFDSRRDARVWPDLKIALVGIERPCRARCGGRYAEGKSSETPNWSGPDKS